MWVDWLLSVTGLGSGNQGLLGEQRRVFGEHISATIVYWEQGVKNPCGGFLVTAQVTEPSTPHAAGYRAAALLKARSVIDLVFSWAWF